jgi:hypothetical protein
VDLEDLGLWSVGHCACMHCLVGHADSDRYISILASGPALGCSLYPAILNLKESNSGQAENIGKFPTSSRIAELPLNFVQLIEAKSLVVALCMASVCAEASMAYYCRQAESQCSDRNLRRRSFYLAVLYEFFRETSCDVRDIVEDAKEGLKTLPVKLGKQNTMLLMTVVGLLLDSILTQSVAFTASGIIVRSPQLAHAILRIGLTMIAYWQILKYPRDNYWAWGCMSLFGLVPVLFAQAALHS